MKIVLYTKEPSWKNHTPQNVLDGLNRARGREIGFTYLAIALAKVCGHNVTVFTPNALEQKFNGVIWRNSDNFLPMLMAEKKPIDVLAGLSWVHCLGGELVKSKTRLRINLEMTLDFITGDTEQYVDFHLCQSRFHQRTLLNYDPTIDGEKVYTCSSIGVFLGEFTKQALVPKSANKFVWMSSPDRGLWHMLRLWPKICNLFAKDQPPTLDVYYDFNQLFEATKWGSDFRTEMLWQCKEQIDQPGITVHSDRPRNEILDKLAQCLVFFYPMDPIRHAENLCLTVQEAMACDCVVVTSDADCLGELYGRYTIQVPQQDLYDDAKVMSALTSVFVWNDTRERQLNLQRSLIKMCNIQKVSMNLSNAFQDMLRDRGFDSKTPS